MVEKRKSSRSVSCARIASLIGGRLRPPFPVLLRRLHEFFLADIVAEEPLLGIVQGLVTVRAEVGDWHRFLLFIDRRVERSFSIAIPLYMILSPRQYAHAKGVHRRPVRSTCCPSRSPFRYQRPSTITIRIVYVVIPIQPSPLRNSFSQTFSSYNQDTHQLRRETWLHTGGSRRGSECLFIH